jgi:ectoine hydroxylase-related dioxygenase (phytanoyl-CoA dioxygenase family)
LLYYQNCVAYLSLCSRLSRCTMKPNIALSEQQIAEFHERGFIALPAITSAVEVQSLRGILERLFRERAGRKEGAQFDMMSHDDEEEPEKLPTIINPLHFASELRSSQYRANALAIAKQLLGPTATASFEHAILKPARYGAPTPWHQDEATRVDPNFDYNQLSIWMPLQEATLENGCMLYIPGTNKREILPHHSPNSDPRLHSIECAEGFDPSDAVPCPVPAGGAAIHHGRTLHTAGSNSTDTPRLAYILAFEVPPVPRKTIRDFYWNREKRTANLERKRNWRSRGGILVDAVRRIRYGALRSPERFLFEVRRATRAMMSRLGGRS